MRVILAADQGLVAESVRTALTARGHTVRPVRWPAEGAHPRRPHGEQVAADEVGVLMSDLDRWSRVRAACQVLSGVATRWVVITSAPPAPSWGALLEAGARAVLPGDTGLDDLGELLGRVAAGDVVMPAAEQDRLRRAWRETLAERRQVGARLRSLTPREREVLRLLYAGESVAAIAARSEVSAATVRSQVKSVLRKLDVNSQLGAVAALGQMLRIDQDSLAPSGRRGAGRRRGARVASAASS